MTVTNKAKRQTLVTVCLFGDRRLSLQPASCSALLPFSPWVVACLAQKCWDPTLAAYQVALAKKSHHIAQVHGGHVINPPFRSPPLSLFDLEDGWLLYLPARERAHNLRRGRGPTNIEQLPLPDFLLPESIQPLQPGPENSPPL